MPVQTAFVGMGVRYGPQFSKPVGWPITPSGFVARITRTLVPVLYSVRPRAALLFSPGLLSSLAVALKAVGGRVPLIPTKTPNEQTGAV